MITRDSARFGAMIFEALEKKIPRDVADAVSESMRERKILHIIYESRHRPGVRYYVVEPYSWRKGDLYAYDRRAGHIKRFRPGRMIAVAVGVTEFEPRWAVELSLLKGGECWEA